MGKKAQPRQGVEHDLSTSPNPQVNKHASVLPEEAPRKCEFFCHGHENIRAKHHSTIEFTRAADLTRRGTCIIGVRAEFDSAKIKQLRGKVRVTVEVAGLADKFYAFINPDFHDEEEIVFRQSRFNSSRTLGFSLNKGAAALRRDIASIMKNPQTIMRVTLEEIGRKPQTKRSRIVAKGSGYE